MAIMNARLYDRPRRNDDEARTWIEKSLALTGRLDESPTKAVNIAFLMNTLALVEMRQGRPLGAVRLLSDAIAFLKKHAPDKYEMESTILLHNVRESTSL